MKLGMCRWLGSINRLVGPMLCLPRDMRQPNRITKQGEMQMMPMDPKPPTNPPPPPNTQGPPTLGGNPNPPPPPPDPPYQPPTPGRSRPLAAIAAFALIAASLFATTTPASAAVGGCATWGCASGIHYSNGAWFGSVKDVKQDGYCVSLWTINGNGSKVKQLARDCHGVTMGGSANGGGAEDAYGIRMFRDDGRYKTLVWPG